MLKQTLFFSKSCKLSFRLKQLVEEEKRYTTYLRQTPQKKSCCGLLKKRKDIQRLLGYPCVHVVVAC